MASTPSLQDYLDAASDVYKPSTTAQPPGLTLLNRADLDTLENPADGFFAQTFQDGLGNIIIAFEGTSDNLPGAQAADIDILLGGGTRLTRVLNEAFAYALQVRSDYGASHTIYVTGHSLGGAEAESIASTVSGIAGGVAFAAPGLPGFGGSGGQNSFTNYVAYGDWIANYTTEAQSPLNVVAHTANPFSQANYYGKVDYVGDVSQQQYLSSLIKDFVSSKVEGLFAPLLPGTLSSFVSNDAEANQGFAHSFHDLNYYAAELGYGIKGPAPLTTEQTSNAYATLSSELASIITSNSVSSSDSSPHPVVTGPPSANIAINASIPISSLFAASETPTTGDHYVDHYSIFIVRGSSAITIGDRSYALGSIATDVTPAQFNLASFSAGADVGTSEVAVVAFDDLGNQSVAGDVTIAVTVPQSAPQPIVETDDTRPSIVSSSHQVVTAFGGSSDLTSTYLQVDDQNSANYSPQQLTYTIVSAPTHGYIIKGGSIVSTFTQSDVNNHLIEYQQNGTLASNDSFTYFVSDPAGNRTGNQTFGVAIDAPPTASHPALTTNDALSVAQGGTQLITDSNLFVTDSGLNPWQIIYTITGAPTNGQIIADGINVVTSFTQQQVDLGLISYQNSASISGLDGLTFTVSDSEGGTVGQTAFDINVIPKNNLHVNVSAPLYTDPEGQANPNGQASDGTNIPGYVSILTPNVLSSIDPGVDASNITYSVTSMPADAGFLIGAWGVPEGASFVPFTGQDFGSIDIANGFPHSFTQAQLNEGQVFYRQSENGLSSGQQHYGDQFSVTLTVSDNTGNTINDVTLPIVFQGTGFLSNGTLYQAGSIPEPHITDGIGATTILGGGLLTAISPTFSHDQIRYILIGTPQHGSVLLNGVPLAENANFSQTDIDQGHLAYREDGSAVTSDNFLLSVDHTQVIYPTEVTTAIHVFVDMTGDHGGQVLNGGPDNETLVPGLGDNFLLGDGPTTLDYGSSPNGVSVDLINGTVDNGYGGTDSFTNVHSIIGSPHSDTYLSGSGFDLTGGAGNDTFRFDSSAITDSTAGIFDHIVDYDQGNSGHFISAEGDQIDLSGLTGGTSFNGLVHVVDDGDKGTFVVVDADGATGGVHYQAIAQLDGIHAGHVVNVIDDSAQPAGVTLGVESNQGLAGNFNSGSDGNSDLLWRNDSGAISLWEMNGNSHIGGGAVGNLPTDWNIAGLGDFNGDGNSDLLLRNDSGAMSIWEMNGNAHTGGAVGPLSTTWHVAGVGDFDGNGKSDIVLHNDNGSLSIWEMDGRTHSGGGPVANLPSSWNVAGVGDFNGDGKSDLLLRNDSGAISVWEMNGHTRTSGGLVANLTLDWHVEGVGDFNNDGKSDIVLRNDNGAVSIWEMNGTAHTGASAGKLTPDWHLAGTGDFNGDGHSDLIWRNDSRVVSVWEMNGGSHTGGGVVANLGDNWSIQAHHFDLG